LRQHRAVDRDPAGREDRRLEQPVIARRQVPQLEPIGDLGTVGQRAAWSMRPGPVARDLERQLYVAPRRVPHRAPLSVEFNRALRIDRAPKFGHAALDRRAAGHLADQEWRDQRAQDQQQQRARPAGP
jgi:hypothetical protein